MAGLLGRGNKPIAEDDCLAANGVNIDCPYCHSWAAGFESDDISDLKRSRHWSSPSREGIFSSTRLRLVAKSESFHDDREPPLRIGDVVRLNSGGPAAIIVDVSSDVTISWRDDSRTHEHAFPRACVHRLGVIGR